MTRAAAPLVAAAALAATLAGCDKPKPRDPPPPLPSVGPGPSAIDTRLPAWAAEVMNKPLASLYPEPASICVGNADNVQSRSAEGAELVGWGWDPETKAPIPRILLVGEGGVVVGAGEPGVPRPDVNAARPEITAPDTGWSALTARTGGPVDVFGVIGGGKVVCRLGRLDLG